MTMNDRVEGLKRRIGSPAVISLVIIGAFFLGSVVNPVHRISYSVFRSSDSGARFLPTVMASPLPNATHPCLPVPDEEVCPLLYGPYKVIAEGKTDGRRWQFVWFLSGFDGLCLSVIDPKDKQTQYGPACDPWDGNSIQLRLGSVGSSVFAIGPVTSLAKHVRVTFENGRTQLLDPITVSGALSLFIYGPVKSGENALPRKAEALRSDNTVITTDAPKNCSSYRPC